MQQHKTYYGVSPPTLPSTTISTAEFARMHIEHITAHPPDSVLFPFLHGLEGENNAQCMFFASSGTPDKPLHNAGMIRDQNGRVVRPPRYRGLLWVLADEDTEPSSSPTWDDDEYDSDSEDYSDEDHDVEMGSPESDVDADSPQTQHHDQTQDDYMHPLTPRISTADPATNTKTSVPCPSAPLNIAYANASPPPHAPHDRRDSSASSTESSSSSTDASSSNSDSRSISTSATSQPSASCSPPGSFDSTNSHFDQPDTSQNSSVTASPHKHTKSKYPILTCSFLPSQLIQPCPSPRTYDFNGWRRGESAFEIDWEFKPAKVPDGISLRNFGIQVAIYASVSDIIVYSPKGPTSAAFRVAERFKRAVARKRRERLERWCQAGFGSDPAKMEEDGEDPHSTPDGFLKYGVYVLDANAEQLERDMSWLVARKDGDCSCDCDQMAPARVTQATTCFTFDDGMTHGLTEATDGRLVGELEIEARLAAEQGEESVPREQESNGPQVAQSTVHLNANARLHRCRRANTIDFAQREKDEMRDLTRASEILTVWDADTPREEQSDHVSGSTTATYWNPNVGQVFLGNASDVPLWRPTLKRRGHIRPPTNQSDFPGSSSVPPSSTYLDPFSDFESETPSPFNSYTNDPSRALGFDICIECHEHAPLPSAAHLRAAEEHIRMMEVDWVEGWRRHWGLGATPCSTSCPPDAEPVPVGSPPPGSIPPRPPPHPSAIVHLPFPSCPQSTPPGLNALLPVIRFLEKMVTPGGLGYLTVVSSGVAGFSNNNNGSAIPPIKHQKVPSSWSPIPESPFNSRSGSNTPSMSTNGSASKGYPIHNRKTDVSESTNGVETYTLPSYRPRPLKVLLYSSDGYTESSVPALCLLMAVKGLSLPEAYLEMQVTNRRSFFVYQSEVSLLRKVEARLGVWNSGICSRYLFGDVSRSPTMPGLAVDHPPVTPSLTPKAYNRPHGLTINHGRIATARGMQRPRASTLPSFVPDHQCWFDDARFDGSFPSRVLPFLYLGNLNHAANAYMLHALGITHVVSVGECALVPPPHTPEGGCPPLPPSASNQSNPTTDSTGRQSPGNQGSLWIEEREGRIKVLDIKGVCDDGIDTLEPQLHPICTWIERARLSGGRVLVHCRVGVSRSATVTIAYVMQHLGLSLVEAYLVVRSRRLSVLIQPNMRLLYNLLGWEVRLARERAGGDERKLREELGRALSWPYLAREVHALNEKYLS